MNHSTGRRNPASASTGPAARSARLSARRMAIVLGVTSAKMSRKTESTSDTSRSPQNPNAGGMKRTDSRVAANEARISASVLTTSTVDRNRFGSCCRRCRTTAAGLPSSARWRTRSRPTDVSAVSVAEASAATATQITRSAISPYAWLSNSGRSAEQLAHAAVLVHAHDGLGEQRGDAEHGERAVALLGRYRDRVGDHELVDGRQAQALEGALRQDGVGAGDDDVAGAVRLQRPRDLDHRAAGRDDVLDHDAVAAVHVAGHVQDLDGVVPVFLRPALVHEHDGGVEQLGHVLGPLGAAGVG